jgi:hypothetical protein
MRTHIDSTPLVLTAFTLIACLAATLAAQQPVSTPSSPTQSGTAVISVDSAHPGAAISPSLFGLFFEDINFAADGGLYPELVKNRSFEFADPLTGWHAVLGYSDKGLTGLKAKWLSMAKIR